MRLLIRFALFALVAVEVGGAAAQSLPYTKFTEWMTLTDASVSVDVYLPSEASPQGVAILAHGFGGTRKGNRDLAQALAAAGFVAIAPDLPGFLDPQRNAEAIITLVHHLETGNAGIAAVPRNRLVLVGTSMGGLAAVLAAAELSGIAGWVGLDPVDQARSGARAATRINAPAVVLLAKPSICNLNGNGSAIARAAPGLLRSSVVEGASHCDFEGPTNSVCRAACGRGSNAAQLFVREEAVRAVAQMLQAPDLRDARFWSEVND